MARWQECVVGSDACDDIGDEDVHEYEDDSYDNHIDEELWRWS